MNKGTVCLTFDFDAISLWLQRDMTTMTSVSRGEFCVIAVPRILHLLAKRNIQCTWFIPGHTIETYPDVCKMIVENGHEIALHGYAHENFNVLSSEEEWGIFQKSVKVIESLTGCRPKGFRSPSWDISSRTVKNLEKLGIIYDSSQMGNDYSVYYSRYDDEHYKDKASKFGKSSNVVEIPVSWSLDDYVYFEYLKTPNSLFPGLKTPDEMFKNWTGDVEYMLRDFQNGVLVATFHPQVSGRGHRLLGLEKWIDSLIEKGIVFSRLDSIADSFLNGIEFGVFDPK
ncbi:polysaccharide deacetylase [Bacillus sp. JJ1503]|uniref:polysaccharide deacetylase family protein n=1 Tax=unclassified Bacillus (in: firmicutes) TaxID=185979 RepID=UPI002FFDF72C